MQEVLTWMREHHEFMSLIAWPLMTALVTLIFKPRTPEQYEALAQHWPRLARALILIAALGFDPIKATKAARQLVDGKPDPKKSPSIPPPPDTKPSLGEEKESDQ